LSSKDPSSRGSIRVPEIDITQQLARQADEEGFPIAFEIRLSTFDRRGEYSRVPEGIPQSRVRGIKAAVVEVVENLENSELLSIDL
jgi:hypothetical protein